ncbi:hypothetical protein R6Q57_000622 [Mikania cordata]
MTLLPTVGQDGNSGRPLYDHNYTKIAVMSGICAVHTIYCVYNSGAKKPYFQCNLKEHLLCICICRYKTTEAIFLPDVCVCVRHESFNDRALMEAPYAQQQR